MTFDPKAMTTGADAFEHFLREAPAAIAMFDREMRYLHASERWIEDYGLRDADIIGKSHYEVFPEIEERWKALHRRTLAGETLSHEQDPFPRADGSVDYVRWRNVPWRDAAGEIGGIIMFTEVVTEEVEPQALQLDIWSILSAEDLDVSAKIDALLTRALRYYRLDFGLLTRLDGEFCELRHFVGSAPGLAQGDRVKLAESYCDLVVSSGEICAYEHFSRSDAADHPCYAKRGLETFIGAPIHVGGRLHGVIAFGAGAPRPLPFTARQRTTMRLLTQWIGHEVSRQANIDALEKSEQRFALAAAGSSVGIWEWIEVGSEPQFWSDQFYALIGYEPDELPATLAGFLKILHPDDHEHTLDGVAKHFQERTPFRVEYRLRHKTNGYRWFLGSGQTVWDETGAPTRMIGSIMDIHESKVARAEAEEANRAKSSFLATMSHEIRTPLNGVLGMAEVLARTDLSARQETMVSTIVQSGRTLLQLLNDVLDVSKIEAGKVLLETVEFDLDDVVSGVRVLHELRAEEKGLDFETEIADAARGGYLGDPTRIAQVLNNLVSNALKFTEAGGVRIRAEHLDDERDGSVLAFTVTDTGIGVDPSRLPALFAPFAQADASTTRKFGGTGLGLSICKSLVELMGGWLKADSAPGAGSTFRFAVPIERLAPGESKSVAASIEAAAEDGGARDRPRLDILVAEDNPANRAVIEAMLSAMGARLTIAVDGHECVEACERANYDLILMDLQMPEIDGLEACRRIRAREAEKGRARTPIVALTASATPDHVARCVEAGMDDHLAKPVTAAALGALLAAISAPAATDADAAPSPLASSS